MSASTIRNVLQEVNGAIFSPRGIALKLLKDCPEAIPTLIQWIFDEWHPYDATLTKTRLHDSYNKRLNNDRIPFVLVALRNTEPIGTISLKESGEPEFVEYANASPWMGSLHVAPSARNQGLGQALLSVVKIMAERLGYEELFFYTSNSANVEWYSRRGAQVLERRPFRNHSITMMKIAASLAYK